MRRREFITLVGGAAIWPIAVRAQQSGKLPIIGYMGQGTPAAETKRVASFAARLRELSWIEGRTVVIEYRWTEGRGDLATDIASEFARRKVDIIVTSGTPLIAAAKQRPHRSQSCLPQRVIRSVADLSQAWRGQAATLPACRL
jgi:putative ABC transport system substrate-binding protein